MNKKIVPILFLSIVLVSLALTYIYFNQPTINEQQYDGSAEDINNENVADEIDDTFIEEDSEIEIGEMV
jgi:hypothetical protein